MSDQNTPKATKKTQSKSATLSSPLPNTLKVLGTTFRVEKANLEEEVVGDTLGLYRRIRISDTLDNKKAWSVLVHEWVHAVMYINGVASVIPDEVEEIIAQSLEHALEEFLLQVGHNLVLIVHSDEENAE